MMKKATVKIFASYLIASTLSFVCGAEAAHVQEYYIDLTVQFTGGNIDVNNPGFEVSHGDWAYKLGNCVQNTGSTPNSKITICNLTDKGKNVSPTFTKDQPILSTIISSTSSDIKCGEEDGEEELFQENTAAMRFDVTYDKSGTASCEAVIQSVNK